MLEPLSITPHLDILPIVVAVAVQFVWIIPTVISIITQAWRINTRASWASMLASFTVTDNWWKGAVYKAYIINSNVTKYVIAPLRLKDDFEGRSVTTYIQLSLQPLFAWESNIETQWAFRLFVRWLHVDAADKI